jgi:hypothetical protein
MRQCLFCDQVANSREHVWPAWVLRKLKITRPMRHIIGKQSVKILPKAELLIKCVCKSCNGGWMHDLEDESLPTISPLMHDISIRLNLERQNTIARWAVKTAMVGDAIDKKTRDGFYSREECEQLRLNSSLPERLFIWLGRYSRSSLGNFGTDMWIDFPEVTKAGNGCVTTLIVGHLAIQVLAVHVRPEYSHRTIEINSKPGPWNSILIPIWPSDSAVSWPPPVTFGSASARFPIGMLMDRWRIGIRA